MFSKMVFVIENKINRSSSIPDEGVSISLHIFRKGMNLFILPPAIGK